MWDRINEEPKNNIINSMSHKELSNYLNNYIRESLGICINCQKYY